MSPELSSVVVVISLLLVLASGMPIAFGLTGVAALLLYVFLGPSALLMVAGSAFKQVGTEVFIAIPLFVFMAAILQFSGMAEKLYRVMHMWMGRYRGGLLAGTMAICALIDALSGIGATATATMGLIGLPEMVKRGYNRPMVLGGIAAGGALGPLIPPSVLMIIVGGYAQLSVGKVFAGGVIPGLVITAAYITYITVRCWLRPKDGPPVSVEEAGTIRERLKGLLHIVPPLGMIGFIMGGIYGGAFTPTEASGFGALGALLIAALYKSFSFKKLADAALIALRVSCMIMWLVIGGGCFSALVTVSGTSDFVAKLLAGMECGPLFAMLILLAIPWVMGMFIDPVAISMICIPIFIPIVKAYSIDMLYFMLLFVICVVIGYITPPFGLNIFYMKGVAPSDVTIKEIYEGILPYCIIKTACLGLFIMAPQLVIFLPNLLK